MVIIPRSRLLLLAPLGLTLILIAEFLLFPEQSRAFERVSIPSEGAALRAYVSPATEEGRDYWVIFIDGNREAGHDHELYRRVRSAIRSDVSVLAVDLEGFGGPVAKKDSRGPAVSIGRSISKRP